MNIKRVGTIYLISNSHLGESYVGKTLGNPGGRWAGHITALQKGFKPFDTIDIGNIYDWAFTILEFVEVESDSDLNDREMDTEIESHFEYYFGIS